MLLNSTFLFRYTHVFVMDFFNSHMSLRARYWSLKNNSTESKKTEFGSKKLTMTSLNFLNWNVIAKECSTLMANFCLSLMLFLLICNKSRLTKRGEKSGYKKSVTTMRLKKNDVNINIVSIENMPVIIFGSIYFHDISNLSIGKVFLTDNDVLWKKWPFLFELFFGQRKNYPWRNSFREYSTWMSSSWPVDHIFSPKIALSNKPERVNMICDASTKILGENI